MNVSASNQSSLKRSIEDPKERDPKRECLESSARHSGISLDRTKQIVDRVFAEESTPFKEEKCQALQNQLNRYLQDPEREEGDLVRFRKKEGDIPLWCQEGPRGTHISIIQNFLAKGQFKKIKEATHAFIPKDSDSAIAFKPRVLARVPRDDVSEVKKGLKIHKKILQTIPNAKRYFMAFPIIYPVSLAGKLELESERQDGTLQNLIDDFCVMTKEGPKYATPLEMIQGLYNVASGIEHLGSMGISHQDILDENIFLKLQEDGRLIFRIADFDNAVENIPCNIADERMAPHLNHAAKQGIVSKETDPHSMVMLIANTLIFGFSTLVQDEEFKEEYKTLLGASGKISKEHLKSLRSIQIEMLRELLPEEAHVLLEPFSNYECKDLKKPVLDLLRYAVTLELTGPSPGAIAIRRFITTLIIAPQVLPLLDRTLKADVECENYLDESSSSEKEESVAEDSFQEAALSALAKVTFPSIGEIKQVLFNCSQLAEKVQGWT